MLVSPFVVIGGGGLSMENCAFVQYEQHDVDIFGWLLCDNRWEPTMYNRLIGDFSYASMLWFALNRIFGSQSTTKAMRYCSLLHNFHKNDMSMLDYLAGIKHLCDSLAGCSKKVCQKEQQSAILKAFHWSTTMWFRSSPPIKHRLI